MGKPLTVDDLFGRRPVSPLPASRLRFNSSGSHLAFLAPAPDVRGRLDLWLAECGSGVTRCILDTLTRPVGETSAADRERQERQRQFASGVTTYEWFPDGQSLLVPIGDQVLQVDLQGGCIPIPLPDAERGDLRLSSTGRWLTYVAGGNLYVYELATGALTAVTQDGGGTVTYGLAEFIAQEEMHRFEGYWWAPDDSRLVFTRVDEQPIPETQRLEVIADAVIAVPQRYAYAGGPNACVSLHVMELASLQTRALDPGIGTDDYLARIGFVGQQVAVQIQSRSQQQLQLRGEDGQGTFSTWLTETSATWINLHDNLRPVGQTGYLWTSERDGLSRLFIGDRLTSDHVQAVSPPDLHICSVIGNDDQQAWVLGWRQTPIERHLYAINFADGSAEQLTDVPGWHDGVWHQASQRFGCTWSDSANPHQVQLHTFGDRHEHRTLHALPADHAAFEYTTVAPVFGSLTASDGQQLYWRVTPPLAAPQGNNPPAGTSVADAVTYPVIVYVYGGPGAQKVCNAWGPAVVQLLSHAGFGVLELDNRGSAHRGRAFEAPLFHHMGGVEVDDQLEGLRVLESFAWADRSRVGIYGHSYGGFMTLTCLCLAPERFKAGVAVAPVSDWRLYDTHYTERYLGNPAADEGPYQTSSVLPKLQQLRRPLLLVHGMADDNVLVTHTTKLMRELQHLGKPFELMLYPGSRHALQETDVSRHRFTHLLDFFRRSL